MSGNEPLPEQAFDSRQSLTNALHSLTSDNTLGAAELLRHAKAAFQQLNSEAQLEQFNLQQAQRAVLNTCVALVSAQPDMAPLLRLASAALTAARIAGDPSKTIEDAERAASNFIANAAGAAQRAASHCTTLIRDDISVLTHSRSSTVLCAFVNAASAGIRFSVVVTESRPMLEGRSVAEAVASLGIPVMVVADAAAALAMERVDIALVGADKITPVNLINKIGTRMIALAAREKSLPLYGVCDSSKFIAEDLFGTRLGAQRDDREVWADSPKGVTVSNVYFEPTPIRYFSGIVTEDGVMSPSDAAGRAEVAIDDELLIALRMRGVEGIR
jgi:translation initiation factor eIF-2B subunit delta